MRSIPLSNGRHIKLDEKLYVVNKQDKVIGKSTYDKVHKDSLRHRTVHILLFNKEKTKLLITQRSNIVTSAGKFTTSAGGHLRADENYKQAAIRELNEELHLKVDLIAIKKYQNDTRLNNKENTTLFIGYIREDTIIVLNKEVQNAVWLPIKDVKNNTENYTKSLLNALNIYEFNIFK